MNEQNREEHSETDPNPYVPFNYNKRGTIEKVGEVQFFQELVLDQFEVHIGKMKLYCYLISHKNKFQVDYKSKCKR